MKPKVPSNLRFLFPVVPDKEMSSLLFETGRNLVEEIDTIYAPEYEQLTPHGGLDIMFQSPKRYLLVSVAADGQSVMYQGANTDDSAKIDGRAPITDDFSFLGDWLDNESTT